LVTSSHAWQKQTCYGRQLNILFLPGLPKKKILFEQTAGSIILENINRYFSIGLQDYLNEGFGSH